MKQLGKKYDEFVKSMIEEEDKIIDYKNEKCINCNDCCGMMTFISKEEFKELKNYFTNNKVGKIIYQKAVKRVLDFNRENPNVTYFQCPLSNGLKKCEIYSRRPAICRDFHCSPHLNTIEDKMQYSGEAILSLFADDLFKDENYKDKVMRLFLQLKSDHDK